MSHSSKKRLGIYTALLIALALLCVLCLENDLFLPKEDRRLLTNLKKHVNYLCSDALAGRQTGTAGEKLAADYIAQSFRELSLKPGGDAGTFYQTFNLPKKASPTNPLRRDLPAQGQNVIATLTLDPNATSILIIGAHYDHLGTGEVPGSRAHGADTGKVHPGADDNASGVATLIEVARQLAELQASGQLDGHKNIVFAAWSGEELGVLGSTHFIKQYLQSNNQPKIEAVINLDMVGHLRDYLLIQGIGSSRDWSTIIEETKKKYPFDTLTQGDPYLPTDALSFYLRGIPSLNLFSGIHDSYHTPQDKPKFLNYAGINAISQFLRELILTLENTKTLTYQAIEKPRNLKNKGVRVYLGTIPDYTDADSVGVKLTGFVKGSPAEAAGIQSGDILLQLANKDIQNIYDYAAVLRDLTREIQVEMVVLRNNQKLSLTIFPTYLDDEHP